ncbi:MAG: pyrroline-5-carboxylate reductase [Plesiomonas sp.]
MTKEQDYPHIAFLGAGNMAQAIIAGLCKAGYPPQAICATNRTAQTRHQLGERYGIRTDTSNLDAASNAQVVVLGVKPQNMAEALITLHDLDMRGKLVISLAAGISIARLQQLLPSAQRIIRVMPNTPALLGAGMSGLYAGSAVTATDRTYAEQLLGAVGKICWLAAESDINSVIAASGSAPAYFFLFMQAMQAEAQQMGCSPEIARLLVQQAALGAARMVDENPQLSLEALRAQVTSKGGTTAEAIRVFNEEHLAETVAKAMQAAVKRAQEMEKLF